MKKSISLFLALLLILTMVGCQQEEEQPTVDGPQYWGSMPALTYGVMESEKLEILPWYGARAEETSCYMLIETETGYYMLFGGNYFFADKADMASWVLVCNDPECRHNSPSCNSRIYMSTILMKEGRIWYEYAVTELPGQYTGNGNGTVLVSASPSGSDRKIEVLSEETMVFNAGSTSGGLVFPNYRLLRKVEMQENGLYQFQWFLFDDSGCQEIYGTEAEKALGMYNPAYRSHGINGEICIQDTAIDKEKFFRIENGEMAWVDPSGLPLRGSYLSGDVLRIFRTNDGYYDVNLNTREEVKLADAQLENSYASIVLPNCIVESTLFGDQNFTPRQNEQTHAMKLFDGQTWRNVELPEELLTAGKSEFLMIYGVTSDSILLRHHLAGANLTRVEYYRIDLTAQEPALEYMGVLDLPM